MSTLGETSGGELMALHAAAISEAARRLDEDAFRRAVELLNAAHGKVVVSGAGTSGIIARKIAVTLTSTGTSSVFLHPSDALHGALGIVQRGDIAVVVSNSGETDELLALLPYLGHRDVPYIAIVGNVSSTVARGARVVLDAFTEVEACPLNLAPTASTSVALALGDALAMTVMRSKSMTPQKFALNHPSGRLGKRLTLKVDDLMHAGDDHPALGVLTPWLEVLAGITRGGLGAVTVEDDGGRLLGIITDGDLRRMMQNVPLERLPAMRAGDIMTPHPVVVRTGLLAHEALRLMEDRPSQINVLPVIDEVDRCVGLLRLHDVVRSGI